MTLITKASTLLVSESNNLATQINTGGTGYISILGSGSTVLATALFAVSTPLGTPDSSTGVASASAVPLVGSAITSGIANTYRVYSGAANELFRGDVGASYVFTVNTTTEIITATGNNFIVGDKVSVSSDTTLPSPLSSSISYFVLSVSGADIQVSLTSGGAAVDLTTTGTGIHKIRKTGASLLLDSGNSNPLQIYSGQVILVNSFSYDPEA